MKYLFSLAFFFNIFSVAVFSQAPPPPKPLIYKAPLNSDLKEFVSEDKTFQITFPGTPLASQQEIDNGKVVSYRVYRQGSNSVVNVVNYNFELADKEKTYEAIKANVLKIPKSTVEAEKEVEINGLKAKEYDVSVDYHFLKIRVFIVGNRIYELRSDVTNWHILSKHSQEKVLEFKNETERFFNSFKVLKSPEIPPVEVPADFLGIGTKNEYKNTFFDFSLSFSSDWKQVDDSLIETSRQVGLEMLKSEKEKVNKAFEASSKNEVVIFLLVKQKGEAMQGPNLGIGVLKQSSSKITSQMVAVVTKNFFLTNEKIKLTKDVEKVQINGTEFSTFSISNQGEIQQTLFTTIRKGYSITFVMSYTNSDERKSLDKLMEGLKFGSK